MAEKERSVVRFSSGRVLKGFLQDFSPGAEEVVLEDADSGALHSVRIGDLKAVFFVKSFEGDNEYKDKKAYGICRARGQRAFVKFKDGESLVGFLDGSVPWSKGFFLSRKDNDAKGFFLYPADTQVNNIKVFVVAAAVNDVTVVP